MSSSIKYPCWVNSTENIFDCMKKRSSEHSKIFGIPQFLKSKQFRKSNDKKKIEVERLRREKVCEAILWRRRTRRKSNETRKSDVGMRTLWFSTISKAVKTLRLVRMDSKYQRTIWYWRYCFQYEILACWLCGKIVIVIKCSSFQFHAFFSASSFVRICRYIRGKRIKCSSNTIKSMVRTNSKTNKRGKKSLSRKFSSFPLFMDFWWSSRILLNRS